MYTRPRVLILCKTSVLTGFFFFLACLFYPLLKSAEISTVTVDLSIFFPPVLMAISTLDILKSYYGLSTFRIIMTSL